MGFDTIQVLRRASYVALSAIYTTNMSKRPLLEGGDFLR